MSLNNTPNSERVHIGIFGRRNAGKSSVINAITNQEVAIVSEVKGTTTDPVFKAMEILPIGPCVLIDTAGLDDTGNLGEMRIQKTIQVLDKTDIALVIIDANIGITEYDNYIIEKIKKKNIPFIAVFNKSDKGNNKQSISLDIPFVYVSAETREGIEELKQKIITSVNIEDNHELIGDLITPDDMVILVTPIDKSAPKGRLILPQQQVIRDILDRGAITIVIQQNKLKETLQSLNKKPKMVITDSQVFKQVSCDTPDDILLTSFSILFARYKGDLISLVEGAKTIDSLNEGDKILIAEACTHHLQDDDIARVKIPKWIEDYSKKKMEFHYLAGVSFNDDIKKYKLIIHCGGCMLNTAAMQNRIQTAKKYNVPIVNYGVLIAYLNGILDRALEPFVDANKLWKERL